MKDNSKRASRIPRHANTRLSANGVLCELPRPISRAFRPLHGITRESSDCAPQRVNRQSKIANSPGRFGTKTKIFKTPLFSIKNFQPEGWDSCPTSRAFRPRDHTRIHASVFPRMGRPALHEQRPDEQRVNPQSKIVNSEKIVNSPGKFGTKTKILKTPLFSISNFQPEGWDSCPISRPFRPSHWITREPFDCAPQRVNRKSKIVNSIHITHAQAGAPRRTVPTTDKRPKRVSANVHTPTNSPRSTPRRRARKSKIQNRKFRGGKS